jgi:hypothetical protein
VHGCDLRNGILLRLASPTRGPARRLSPLRIGPPAAWLAGKTLPGGATTEIALLLARKSFVARAEV